MSDDKNDEVNPERKRFVWKWKDAVIYGVIWISAAALIQVGIMGGVSVYRQIQMFRRFVDGREWIDKFGGNNWNVSPDKKGKIEEWIRKHLPKDAAPEEISAVSDTFKSVAGMLRDGSLDGWNDSCAETIAQLQPKVSRKTWLPFMNGLAQQVGNDVKSDQFGLANFYEKAAKAVAAPVKYSDGELEE